MTFTSDYDSKYLHIVVVWPKPQANMAFHSQMLSLRYFGVLGYFMSS